MKIINLKKTETKKNPTKKREEKRVQASRAETEEERVRRLLNEALKESAVQPVISVPGYAPSVSVCNFTLVKFAVAPTVPVSEITNEFKVPVAPVKTKVNEPPIF